MTDDEFRASLPSLNQPVSRITRVRPEEPQRRITAGAVRWTLLGILGLALAVGVALVASSLASQRIGLSDEPISAGSALQPPRTGKETTRPGDQEQPAATTTSSGTTAPESTTVPVSPTTTAPPAAPPQSSTSTTTRPTQPDGHGEDGVTSNGGGGSEDD